MGQARITHLIRAGAIAVAGSIAVVLPLGALGASTGGAASASTVNPLGVYAGPASPGVVKALGASIGQQPTYAMEFLDGSTWSSIENPSWFVSQWQNSGYKMIWGVPILPNTFSPNSNASVAGGSAYGLAQGAGGAFNSYFVTLAKAFVAAGQGSSIIRLGWEFNGGWFPWAANGSSATFVAYWQNIVNAMRSVSGQSFTFEWNPTLGDQGVGNLANYYPGNNYVDYIGDDVYDVAWATYPGAAAEFSYMETEPYGLNWLASFAASVNKPITFPEWGLGWGPSNNGGAVNAANSEVSGGDDPTFINDMATWIATHNVFEATFWDYGTSVVNGGSNPHTLAALASDFGPNSVLASPARTSPPAAPTTTTTTPTTVAPKPKVLPPVATTTLPPPTTTTTTQKKAAARAVLFTGMGMGTATGTGASTTAAPLVASGNHIQRALHALKKEAGVTAAPLVAPGNQIQNALHSVKAPASTTAAPLVASGNHIQRALHALKSNNRLAKIVLSRHHVGAASFKLAAHFRLPR